MADHIPLITLAKAYAFNRFCIERALDNQIVVGVSEEGLTIVPCNRKRADDHILFIFNDAVESCLTAFTDVCVLRDIIVGHKVLVENKQIQNIFDQIMKIRQELSKTPGSTKQPKDVEELGYMAANIFAVNRLYITFTRENPKLEKKETDEYVLNNFDSTVKINLAVRYYLEALENIIMGCMDWKEDELAALMESHREDYRVNCGPCPNRSDGIEEQPQPEPYELDDAEVIASLAERLGLYDNNQYLYEAVPENVVPFATPGKH